MPAAVSSLFARMRRTVDGFSVAQRTIALIGIAALVMGGFALATWLTRPSLSPLFTGLSASDASAVVEQLQGSGVAYELADGGSTVLVPEGAVYEQRLAAAASGLPSASSDGYTLLDDMGVTSSEFQQSVTYKRAIEGELARTIAALDGVGTASVQLAIPEESVFVAETIDPTASVFVETTNGTALASAQVEAIVHLTSAAVSGMKPENVAVVDQAGRTLSAVGVGATGGADQQAGDHEARIAAGIQQMLDTVVGAGNSTVTVAAEIDRATSERVEETYAPAEGVLPSSEQSSTEKYTGGAGGTEAGVLGPDNIAVPSGDGDGTYESTETIRNNALNRSVETTTTPAGSVTRQTVSVAVDEAAAGAIGVGQIRDLVSTAAGIDLARGDEVNVEVVAFSDTAAVTAQEALEAARIEADAERMAEIVRVAVIAGAVVLVLVAAVISGISVSRRRARTAELEGGKVASLLIDEPTDSFAALLHTTPTAQLEARTAGLATALLEPEPEPDPEPVQISLDRRRAELGEFARRDPARTAELLRSLMGDRQDA
ncbi:flagellar basal-body MS-ring/collar protein FliF [Microbacterium sp. RU33B]|uniref:flagellar basal-body MS-ring/collar protein FliF n=1 Tax=Microbacterium sp. RU33B TaxID=1907390 RepID=UPI00095AA763|nr:flagellar basal-body MS-ring/collar protein FliF [Microbacterium sp. RU33B]SIT83256.1 flagellar M-ring protein FliF [Microbacterium sp. RU33B]